MSFPTYRYPRTCNLYIAYAGACFAFFVPLIGGAPFSRPLLLRAPILLMRRGPDFTPTMTSAKERRSTHIYTHRAGRTVGGVYLLRVRSKRERAASYSVSYYCVRATLEGGGVGEKGERERKKKGIRATVASRGVFSLLCVHFIHECLADRHGENSSCAFPFSRMKGVTMRKIYKNTTYLPRFPRSFQIYILFTLLLQIFY